MANFMRPPVEDDLLDNQQFDNASSLNTIRQKLGYWVRFVCSLALIIAGFGIVCFSYIFLQELFGYRYTPYKGFWFLRIGAWLLAFVGSIIYACKGNIYGKISVVFLAVFATGLVGFYSWNQDIKLHDLRHVRVKELILISGLYLTGLLAFPAAYLGWRYAQALRVPQVEEEDWEWKTKTARLGWKAWRLGALAFITLGFAWTPIIIDELGYYQRRIENRFFTKPDFREEVQEEVFVEDALEEELEEAIELIEDE